MIGIIQTYTDNLRGHNRRERSDAFELAWFSIERRGTKHIPAQAKDFAVEDLRKENLTALLKSADRCHKAAHYYQSPPSFCKVKHGRWL
jgi:hypothetical protein